MPRRRQPIPQPRKKRRAVALDRTRLEHDDEVRGAWEGAREAGYVAIDGDERDAEAKVGHLFLDVREPARVVVGEVDGARGEGGGEHDGDEGARAADVDDGSALREVRREVREEALEVEPLQVGCGVRAQLLLLLGCRHRRGRRGRGSQLGPPLLLRSLALEREVRLAPRPLLVDPPFVEARAQVLEDAPLRVVRPVELLEAVAAVPRGAPEQREELVARSFVETDVDAGHWLRLRRLPERGERNVWLWHVRGRLWLRRRLQRLHLLLREG
mmetsp:Transcript_12301/g.40376  ORF Transcript_12301/g.40376 Transcript_12301/m.40376 type:complete len:271 (-) Transcript_12301:488-1300(-)